LLDFNDVWLAFFEGVFIFVVRNCSKSDFFVVFSLKKQAYQSKFMSIYGLKYGSDVLFGYNFVEF
jgi:hypothetical protein